MSKFTKSFVIGIFLDNQADDLWFLKNNADDTYLTKETWRAINFSSYDSAEVHLMDNCKDLPFDCLTILPIYIK